MARRSRGTVARSPRRAPTAAQRSASAEATRERILAAATAEFGTKGYAGARTAGIAARAGVNQQLISYYFGGKQGLLTELRRRWMATEDDVDTTRTSYLDRVLAYLDATLDNPDRARLVIWQALGDQPADGDEQPDRLARRLRDSVAGIRAQQASGTITDAFDAEFLLLTAYALTFAPIALPHIVEGIFGTSGLDRQYRQRLRTHLAVLASATVAAESQRESSTG